MSRGAYERGCNNSHLHLRARGSCVLCLRLQVYSSDWVYEVKHYHNPHFTGDETEAKRDRQGGHWDSNAGLTLTLTSGVENSGGPSGVKEPGSWRFEEGAGRCEEILGLRTWTWPEKVVRGWLWRLVPLWSENVHNESSAWQIIKALEGLARDDKGVLCIILTQLLERAGGCEACHSVSQGGSQWCVEWWAGKLLYAHTHACTHTHTHTHTRTP